MEERFECAPRPTGAPGRQWLAFRREVAEGLVELAGVGPGQSVVEMCCGTGLVGLAAARRAGPAGRVLALDRDGATIRAVRRMAGRAGERVFAVQADALRLPIVTADAILCAFGLEYLEGISAAVRHWALHMPPGGTLAIGQWTRPVADGSPDGTPEIGTSAWVLCRWWELAERIGSALAAHRIVAATIVYVPGEVSPEMRRHRAIEAAAPGGAGEAASRERAEAVLVRLLKLGGPRMSEE
jgi:SAM-dependent methyltransferase